MRLFSNTIKSASLAILGSALIATSAMASLEILPQGNSVISSAAQSNSGKVQQQHAFLLYKLILDAGARANGTKTECPQGSDKHSAWCARWNKTYDPSSDTIAGFGDSRLPCISPYGN